jgi:hypothetical protein
MLQAFWYHNFLMTCANENQSAGISRIVSEDLPGQLVDA